MNMKNHSASGFRFGAVATALQIGVCIALGLLGGCQKQTAGTEAKVEPGKSEAPAAKGTVEGKEEAKEGAKEEAKEEGLTLKPEEVEKMGVETSPAKKATYTPDTEGYGVVLSHDTIAQMVAEVATAEAAAHQSHAALARVQRLAGTPGALPAETQEATQRQAAADTAALALAQRRLTASLGKNPPMLNELASGQVKLVRVTFPLGSVKATPHGLRLAHLDLNGSGAGWKTATVWDAPADASVPGRSFFALLKDSDAGEGERLQAWAAAGASESGTLIPADAAVISDSKYWCYVEKQPGTYERVEIDTSKPLDEGYFVKEGVEPGEKIVTTAAGLLLARETNPSTEAE